MAQHHSPAHGPGMGQTRRWARVLVPALIVAAVIFIAINYSLTSLASYLSVKLRSRTAGSTRALQNADEGLVPGLDLIHTVPVDERGPEGHGDRLPGIDESWPHPPGR